MVETKCDRCKKLVRASDFKVKPLYWFVNCTRSDADLLEMNLEDERRTNNDQSKVLELCVPCFEIVCAFINNEENEVKDGHGSIG